MASKLSLRIFGNVGFVSRGFGLGLRNPAGRRSLFTAEAIGIDSYEKQRERSQNQFSGMIDKFRDKMSEFTFSDTKNMIFSEDLKHMVHIIENKPEELALVHQMMKRYNSQNRHLRFGNFVFGPVVMRMYHYFNQPKLALDAFNDPELEGFFDQLSSYQVLCDLLYKNGMFEDILQVFEKIQAKQVQGQRFPRNVTILVFGACYKLNTIQSYEYALNVLNAMKEHGANPVRRVTACATALALNQNAPQVALEIVTAARATNYFTVRNLKIWALAELNRPEDCLSLLRYSIEYDNPDAMKRQTVCQEVLDKVKAAIERQEDKELSLEFERISKALVAADQLSTSTIGDYLDSEIAAQMPPPGVERDNWRGGRDRQERGYVDRSFRGGGNDFRPQRSLAYDRDIRQSLKHE